ncbi:methionine ABC transporter ATP-binding protein [Acinetobacter sp. MD2]|uniref:methionine ABC transporter ATP-binding protein n=1 Tax=Acinetobacter sp. MD2 TaxID=2600066 RepID=UPI002D1E99C8|nr:ATP-binding cassette domain-containing protein [Acinetobacter sp. MD2]MEB3767631.1 ATP-binding cassette domain-containing protein [Acinetobacter sp. MD2]
MVSFGSSTAFSAPHIRIRNLNKQYIGQNQQPIQALKEINLDIPQGRIFGIIGRSGAGKSSLIRSLNGLEQPTSGTVHIHQQELSALSHAELIQLRQRIGMIFQHFNLMSAKTVWDNIALPLKIAGVKRTEIETQVTQVLNLVGLSHKAQHYPSQLSGGQKQRVGIARALVHHPEILLCDEATSALDPESTASILALLKKINHELGITIVLITHEMQVIREICDEVVVIDQGEIVESGAVWSIFSQPQHTITQELLDVKQHKYDLQLNRSNDEAMPYQVLQLKYVHDTQSNFDLTAYLHQLNTPVQILQSQIDQIQQHTLGHVVFAIAAETKLLSQLPMHAAVQNIQVLGYVRTL